MTKHYGFYARNGCSGSARAQTGVDRVAGPGINRMCVIATGMQEPFASHRRFRDFVITPTDDELRQVIDDIQGKGFTSGGKPAADVMKRWFSRTGRR